MVKNGKIYGIILAIILITIIGVVVILSIPNDDDQHQNVYVPKLSQISIGCDRTIWNNEQLDIKPSINNIDNPLFKWFLDDKYVGNNNTLKQKLDLGEHKISLNVGFGNQTLEDNMSVTVIDSIKGISVFASQESKNQWKFQAQYNRKNAGIKGVNIYIDSLPKKDTNACGYMSIPLMSGDHVWKAEYNGNVIVSGNFSLKEVTEIKIEKIDVKSSYRVGDIVDGKIVLKNTGTTIIKNFDIKTLVVNHKFEWMGDVAKKEYYDKYDSQLKPGELFEIQMQVKIPEKVNGVEPTGKYTLTMNLILNDKIVDKKIVDTEIRS